MSYATAVFTNAGAWSACAPRQALSMRVDGAEAITDAVGKQDANSSIHSMNRSLARRESNRSISI